MCSTRHTYLQHSGHPFQPFQTPVPSLQGKVDNQYAPLAPHQVGLSHAECFGADHNLQLITPPPTKDLLLVMSGEVFAMVASSFCSTLPQGNCEWSHMSNKVNIHYGFSTADQLCKRVSQCSAFLWVTCVYIQFSFIMWALWF